MKISMDFTNNCGTIGATSQLAGVIALHISLNRMVAK